MNSHQVFCFEDAEFSTCELQPTNAEALQRLFEQCEDYAMIVEGESVSPNAANELFLSAPPDKSLDDKFVYGLTNREGEFVGVLEGIRNYPEEATWWIGLFMLIPEIRGHGLGQKVIQSFKEFVHSQKGEAIMLGVVEDNSAAYRFWEKTGFQLVRQTEPRLFGRKKQRVFVMRHNL